MTIKGIIQNRKGCAGSNSSWRVEKSIDSDPFVGTEYELWHYSHLMMRWIHGSQHDTITYLSIGYGTVSDQGGMNTAFRTLDGCYLYYSRKGGASIGYQYEGEWREVTDSQWNGYI